MVLEDSYAALDDAKGNGVPIVAGSETGVYVGCISFEYATVLERGGFKVTTMLSLTHCPALRTACAQSHGFKSSARLHLLADHRGQ